MDIYLETERLLLRRFIPDDVGNLTELDWLALDGNPLTALPDSIGNLTALTRLTVSRTELATLPDTVVNLTGLAHLDLNHTRFTARPANLPAGCGVAPSWLAAP